MDGLIGHSAKRVNAPLTQLTVGRPAGIRGMRPLPSGSAAACLPAR